MKDEMNMSGRRVSNKRGGREGTAVGSNKHGMVFVQWEDTYPEEPDTTQILYSRLHVRGRS